MTGISSFTWRPGSNGTKIRMEKNEDVRRKGEEDMVLKQEVSGQKDMVPKLEEIMEEKDMKRDKVN